LCYTIINVMISVMYMVIARLLLFIVALLTAYTAMAEVYKWVDDQGRVSYGDRPQDESPSQRIEVDDAPTVAPAGDSMSREEKRRRLLETMQEERYDKQQRRAEEKAERERDHRRCIQYKDRMRQFERASRLYSLDREGNRVYMSSEERDRSTQDLQASINKYCH
jgi:cell division protein FtsN